MSAHQTDHPSGRLRRQRDLARACPTNRPQEIVDPGILEEVGGCPGPDRLDGRGVLVDAGHDDDLGVRQLRANHPGRRDAVHGGHRQVDQDDVRTKLPSQAHRLAAIVRLADTCRSGSLAITARNPWRTIG